MATPFVSLFNILHVPTDAFIPLDKSHATVTTSLPFFPWKLQLHQLVDCDLHYAEGLGT